MVLLIRLQPPLRLWQFTQFWGFIRVSFAPRMVWCKRILFSSFLCCGRIPTESWNGPTENLNHFLRQYLVMSQLWQNVITILTTFIALNHKTWIYVITAKLQLNCNCLDCWSLGQVKSLSRAICWSCHVLLPESSLITMPEHQPSGIIPSSQQGRRKAFREGEKWSFWLLKRSLTGAWARR